MYNEPIESRSAEDWSTHLSTALQGSLHPRYKVQDVGVTETPDGYRADIRLTVVDYGDKNPNFRAVIQPFSSNTPTDEILAGLREQLAAFEQSFPVRS